MHSSTVNTESEYFESHGKTEQKHSYHCFVLPGELHQSLETVAENLPLEVFNLFQMLPVITS